MNDETMPLLPCPFCGDEVSITYTDQVDAVTFCAHIECDGCDIDFAHQYGAPNAQIAEEEATELWNTRAQASAPEGEAVAVGMVDEDGRYGASATEAFAKLDPGMYDLCVLRKTKAFDDNRPVSNDRAGWVIACWRYINSEGKPVSEWEDGTPPSELYDVLVDKIIGGSIEVAYTRRNSKPGEVCTWTQDEDDGSWDTACGNKHEFTADGPEENEHKFCPYCGNTLSTHDKTKA